MINSDFIQGIQELSLFFPRFKPTDSQITAWYDRLKDHTGDAMRIAVFELTEEIQHSVPTYINLKEKLRQAENRLTYSPPNVPLAQGYAPESDEKRKLIAEHLQGLVKLVTGKFERSSADELKATYEKGYRQLPNYRSEAEIQRLLDRKAWDILIEIGFMDEPPAFEKPFVPPFSSEKFREVGSYA